VDDLRLYARRRSIDPVIVLAIVIACVFAVAAAAISYSIAPDAVVPGASTPATISVIAGGTRG
jgi:hypothetical protein